MLETVQSFKRLGVIFNYNGSVKVAIKELCKQAIRAMFALLCKRTKCDLPVDVRLELLIDR